MNWLNTFFFMFLILIVPALMTWLANLTLIEESEQEKMSPFECGFNPSKLNSPIFSLRFFKVSILFLIFDAELVILFPSAIAESHNSAYFTPVFLAFIVLLLTLTLWHEQKVGALSWIK